MQSYLTSTFFHPLKTPSSIFDEKASGSEKRCPRREHWSTLRVRSQMFVFVGSTRLIHDINWLYYFFLSQSIIFPEWNMAAFSKNEIWLHDRSMDVLFELLTKDWSLFAEDKNACGITHRILSYFVILGLKSTSCSEVLTVTMPCMHRA